MTDLTTLENLKLDLGLEGTDEDQFLSRSISIASAQVATIVGYPIERASRSITLLDVDRVRSIVVDAMPLHAVTKIVVDGVTWLDTEAAEPIEAGTGFGFTPWGVIVAPYGCFFEGTVEITLESGYTLTDPDRDLPLAFEQAVAEIVKVRRFLKDRDPGIVAESVPGVHSVTYQPMNTDTVPAIVFDSLAPYRAPRVS